MSFSARLRGSGRQDCAGYTLIELLVVLIILGLISALVAPRVFGFLGKAKQDTARLQIDRIGGVLDLYRLETGSLPEQDQGLAALVQAPAGVAGWNGPYVKKADSLVDPWGRPFIYRMPGDDGREFELLSLGADGQPGGEGDDADVTSWQ